MTAVTAGPPPVPAADPSPGGAFASSDPATSAMTGRGLPPSGPELEWTPATARLDAALKSLNRRFAVRFLRRDLGVLLMSPAAGYVLVLETRGRTSGLTRRAPLDYAIVDGAPHVLAGFGTRTHWYRNLLAEPRCRVRLPLRTYPAVAREVGEPAARLRIGRRVLRAAGWAGFLGGLDPLTATDDDIVAALRGVPVMRLEPADGSAMEAGPADPGGWLWIPVHVAWLAAGWLSVALVRRAAGRLARGRRS